MKKGSQAERDLFQELWNMGFGVIRSPSSGSGRKHPQPDLLASMNGFLIGFEVKSTNDSRVYIRENEIKDLKEFCDRFSAFPMVAVKFKYRGWCYKFIHNLRKSSGSSYIVESPFHK